MNAYKGEFAVRVPDRSAGKMVVLTFVYDFTAISRMKSELGSRSVADLLTASDPRSLCQLAAIGLAHHHPDITADDLFRMSPSIMPLVDAIERALHFAYYGPGQAPRPSGDKPANPLKRMAMRLLPAWLYPSKSA